MVGEGRKYLTCLLTPRVEIDPVTLEPNDQLTNLAKQSLKENGIQAQTIQDLISGKKYVLNHEFCLENPISVSDRISELIESGMCRVNSKAPSAVHQIRKWKLLQTDFSVPGGEIGPTFKVMRHKVEQKYKTKIQEMYCDD